MALKAENNKNAMEIHFQPILKSEKNESKDFVVRRPSHGGDGGDREEEIILCCPVANV